MNLEWSFQKLTTKLYLNKDDNTDNFFSSFHWIYFILS